MTMERREFFAATAGIGLSLQVDAAQQGGSGSRQNTVEPPSPRYNGKPQLKITDVQAFAVYQGQNYVYVKGSTDQGIHGRGEAYSAGPVEATVATVRDFKDWLV